MDLTAAVQHVAQGQDDLGHFAVERPRSGLVTVRPCYPTACRMVGGMLARLRGHGFQAWIAEEPERIAVLQRPGERWISPEGQIATMAGVVAMLRERGAPADAMAAGEEHYAEALARFRRGELPPLREPRD